MNLLITEYQAPKEIDPAKATRRFKDACTVAPVLLGVPEERLFTRVRRQAKGGSQYRREEHISHRIIVEEAGHPFELDLRAIWTRVCSSTIALRAVWWVKWQLISASSTYSPIPARQRSCWWWWCCFDHYGRHEPDLP